MTTHRISEAHRRCRVRLTSISLCALVVLCLAQRTQVALTPQATSDKGSVLLLDELYLNGELQQQPRLETVNLSSSAIAPDEGAEVSNVGVCTLNNAELYTGMCIGRACKLEATGCPKGISGYPAGF